MLAGLIMKAKKVLRIHILDRAIVALGLVALIAIGIYVFYISQGNESVARIRGRIEFSVGAIILLPFALFKIKQLVLLIADALTERVERNLFKGQ